MAEDLFDTPALPLLLALEARGVRIELRSDRLLIEPASQLTTEEQIAVQANARTLAAVLRVCDEGVHDRRAAFRRQLEATLAPMVPAFVYRENVPYVKGNCFSCGSSLPAPRFGRCWRCSIGWRLACGLPMSVDLATALDAAKVAS